jgi:Flp pilus assembly protein TadD
VIEIKPDYVLAYTGRGYVYQNEGRRGLARADYVKAATLDPEGEAGRIARKNLKLLDEK